MAHSLRSVLFFVLQDLVSKNILQIVGEFGEERFKTLVLELALELQYILRQLVFILWLRLLDLKATNQYVTGEHVESAFQLCPFSLELLVLGEGVDIVINLQVGQQAESCCF